MKFKVHVFEQHSDEEVQYHYDKTLEDFIGKNYFDRIRKKVFHQITTDKWKEYLMGVLRFRVPVSTAGFDLRIPVEEASDSLEAETRRAMNDTQMRLLWKLAEYSEMQVHQPQYILPTFTKSPNYHAYLWSAFTSMKRELEPFHIV